ncbi:Gfo/Idh/MocA family protein [Paenibacillus sacheonensis]|uniref:Gfo/Idh/MocA family oxidoreductase n=1 Tax=Paenibacillus sacheonensis TaxID=742054 RepID=A0A7X4YJG7_9BACL|nr:Gfo/Idh/MocA family oxidoreductase [Paenibacillus sacheonensis]MBM7564144.1 putative dehydrogenase [Paenibacillus sacheonensis]NBC67526.1 Gfo/Idh/MocA family oxidoreductase [Paenibacillus sacheonensis]
MTKLTASVVGGGQGGQLSMKALADSDRYELKAVADLRPDICEQLQAMYPAIQTFTDHREMLAACPTDIVCVSTFPPSHEEVTLDALKLPLKGILVEKPLGHTVASGRAILQAIQSRGIPMTVPHGMLTKATQTEVIGRVRRGEIGEFKLLEIQCTRWDIINAGIHWLNFFVQLTGIEPLAYVMAQADTSTRTYRDGMQVETVAVTYAQTRSGIRVVMITGDEVQINCEGKETLFRIVGTKGTIEFWGWEDGYILLNEAHPAGELIMPEEFAVTGHRRLLETMADEIERDTADYGLAVSSLAALEIVEGAYLSARCGCKVTFPVDAFEPPSAGRDWIPGIPYSGIGGGRNGRQL